MVKSCKESLTDLWSTGRGPYLLLALLSFAIFLAPWLIIEKIVSQVLIQSIFLIVLVTGVFAISSNRLYRLITVLISVLAVVSRAWHEVDVSNIALSLFENIFAVGTLFVFGILMFRRFLRGDTLLQYRIAAAVAIYLLIGLIWGHLYNMIHILDPNSFAIDHNPNEFVLSYFSFVTLVTLGYGDVVPVSSAARSLAILEGVAGQLYMVILISSLVSEFSSLAVKKVIENPNQL